jgi:glycosyltransferase involved in cell wall biosynthesis
MQVSVIIPFKDPSPNQLHKAIRSVRSQTLKAHEIILIDDGSTKIDYTFGRDMKLVKLDENMGPSAARNAGIKKSTGQLISFLDADDFWLPKKLELSVKEFEKSPDIGMTCGNYRWMINNKLSGRLFYRTAPRITFETLKKINYVASGSVTVRRDVLDDVGMFNEKYWVGEDYELWLRIARKYPVKFINKELYTYRRNDGAESLSVRKDIGDKVFNIKDFK